MCHAFDVADFPRDVKNQLQNISIKFSPLQNLEIELITRFSLTRTFSEALEKGVVARLIDDASVEWKVICLSDLLENKA